jgi:hypothetical protein
VELPLASARTRKGKTILIAGWSSQVARQAHNLKVVGSNPTPVTNLEVAFCLVRKAAFLYPHTITPNNENFRRSRFIRQYPPCC